MVNQMTVNNSFVNVDLTVNGTMCQAYGVPQNRMVTGFKNSMTILLEELNHSIDPFKSKFESNVDIPLISFNFNRGDGDANYLHGHTFFVDDCVLDELGVAVWQNAKRMYRLHPGIKLKHGARRLHRYFYDQGIQATEIKVKGQNFSPIF